MVERSQQKCVIHLLSLSAKLHRYDHVVFKEAKTYPLTPSTVLSNTLRGLEFDPPYVVADTTHYQHPLLLRLDLDWLGADNSHRRQDVPR